MNTNAVATTSTISSNAIDSLSCSAVVQIRDKNLEQITALREDTDASHIADHIRGMVAATMANESAHVSGVAQSTAQQWQAWALGIADDLTLPVADSHQTLLCSTSPC